MVTAFRQLTHRLEARAPYPLALQSLVSLVLLATLPSAFETAGRALGPRFAILGALLALNLALCWLVPARRLRRWAQLSYLVLQVGIASLAHITAPSQLLGYVYLVIVLQAVYLFPPLLWVIFAGGVYAIWSGSLMLASASLLEWTRGNLVLAFPVLCILIAAAVYARQHRRSEQVQQIAQQMQRRYEALVLVLRDAQQRAALEERHRIAQTLARDIVSTLAQVEQSVSNAIGQAQSSLPRIEAPVAQARLAAAAAIERMRDAVVTLRHGPRDDRAQDPPPPLALPPAELMTLRSQRTLNWGLPLAFAGVALVTLLLQGAVTPGAAALFALCSAGVVGGYLLTQRLRNPLLVQLSLAGQVAAVFGLVFVTQALPLTLGLLLVMWQIAMRFSGGQIVTFLVGVQALIGLAIARVLPLPDVDGTQLLIFCVACAAVIGLVGTARRQLSQRYQAEAGLTQLARLTDELEQQVGQVRALAVALERTRVAREIHDDLGHRLVLLNMQLQLVDELRDDDPDAALAQLCSTREQLREAWASVLNTADAVLALDGASLPAALERLAEQCRTLTPMQISLRVIGDLADLEPAIVYAIYRAAQEGLTNACKYARAREAQVLVYCDDVMAEVRVRDDGCGAGPADPADIAPGAAGHFGLIGLRERADQLGGSVEAGPLPEGGFRLALSIPLKA